MLNLTVKHNLDLRIFQNSDILYIYNTLIKVKKLKFLRNEINFLCSINNPKNMLNIYTYF